MNMAAVFVSQDTGPVVQDPPLEAPLTPRNLQNTSLSGFVEQQTKSDIELANHATTFPNKLRDIDVPSADVGGFDVQASSDSDSDGSDGENGAGLRAPKVSERRRAQNMKFSSWLSQRAEKVTKEQVKTEIQNADEETLTIRQLMAKQESNVIITDPRDYQVELFEKAKKQNIIAVLDTGSGKTLIAVLLLRHILDQELEDRLIGKKPRISFFLVDSVTLVFQQFAVLECNLDHKIERFCGEMGCDLWDKGTWEKHFQENMVIVCTAEILYQCLMHSFVALDQINLLIFDEAHHAKKNHAYARFECISSLP